MLSQQSFSYWLVSSLIFSFLYLVITVETENDQLRGGAGLTADNNFTYLTSLMEKLSNAA